MPGASGAARWRLAITVHATQISQPPQRIAQLEGRAEALARIEPTDSVSPHDLGFGEGVAHAGIYDGGLRAAMHRGSNREPEASPLLEL